VPDGANLDEERESLIRGNITEGVRDESRSTQSLLALVKSSESGQLVCLILVLFLLYFTTQGQFGYISADFSAAQEYGRICGVSHRLSRDLTRGNTILRGNM